MEANKLDVGGGEAEVVNHVVHPGGLLAVADVVLVYLDPGPRQVGGLSNVIISMATTKININSRSSSRCCCNRSSSSPISFCCGVSGGWLRE